MIEDLQDEIKHIKKLKDKQSKELKLIDNSESQEEIS